MTAGEEEWREALRRRLNAGQTISGLSDPLWAEPPLDPADLRPGGGPLFIQQQRPQGALRALVGSRIEVKDFVDRDRYSAADDEKLARVTAWSVLPLENAELEVGSVAGIAAAVRALLSARLPGLDWWVPEHWDGPFCKYGILHKSLPAPPNPATGEAMALEIYGTAERAIHPGSNEWAELKEAWHRAGRRDDDEPIAVQFPTRVFIEVATYANVMYPGVRVPFFG
jgi:hypothetical protein